MRDEVTRPEERTLRFLLGFVTGAGVVGLLVNPRAVYETVLICAMRSL